MVYYSGTNDVQQDAEIQYYLKIVLSSTSRYSSFPCSFALHK
jgi:hypothetical protein